VNEEIALVSRPQIFGTELEKLELEGSSRIWTTESFTRQDILIEVRGLKDSSPCWIGTNGDQHFEFRFTSGPIP